MFYHVKKVNDILTCTARHCNELVQCNGRYSHACVCSVLFRPVTLTNVQNVTVLVAVFVWRVFRCHISYNVLVECS